MPPIVDDDIDAITKAMGGLSIGPRKGKKGRVKQAKKKKRRGRGTQGQRGGGIGLGAMMAIGRRAAPIIARASARVLMRSARHLPRHLARAAAQSFIESQLKKEIQKRRQNRYGFLGSIRWAATEKMLEQQKWTREQRESITRKRAAKRRELALRRGKKKTAPAPWRLRIKQAKGRQRRQVHLDLAVKRARSRRGLPSMG